MTAASPSRIALPMPIVIHLATGDRGLTGAETSPAGSGSLAAAFSGTLGMAFPAATVISKASSKGANAAAPSVAFGLPLITSV